MPRAAIAAVCAARADVIAALNASRAAFFASGVVAAVSAASRVDCAVVAAAFIASSAALCPARYAVIAALYAATSGFGVCAFAVVVGAGVAVPAATADPVPARSPAATKSATFFADMKFIFISLRLIRYGKYGIQACVMAV